MHGKKHNPMSQHRPPDSMCVINRGAATQRPLFLAAPGVANAQSAYFSFSQFLQWSDQPIYVLDKDNDFNIAQLARQNAADIVKVQPQGPYLLGGHSYGGAVAMEVAMVLESWGLQIGAVLVGMHLSFNHSACCGSLANHNSNMNRCNRCCFSSKALLTSFPVRHALLYAGRQGVSVGIDMYFCPKLLPRHHAVTCEAILAQCLSCHMTS